MNQITTPPIMLHEMRESPIVPADRLLTFDDGLATQFIHARTIPNRKIFFISTNIICETGKQSAEFITAPDAHKKAFSGNMENYMTIEQIRELYSIGNEIGGHSHFHHNLDKFSTLREKVDHIKMDTELMLEWFQRNLGIEVESFCFPYNDDVDGVYQAILRTYGINMFYGRERININEILV